MSYNTLTVVVLYADFADHPHFDLECVIILSVPESQPKKNRKSCVLTDSGRKKLEDALKTEFGEKGYKIAELASGTTMNRDTISKILHKPQEATTHQNLEKLFQFLNIKLEKSDYNNPPKTQAPPSRHNQTSTSPKTDYATLSESNCEKLKNALRELNYDKQESSFTQCIREIEPAGAFLIHGKSGYGQRWLVNRLRYKVPYFTQAFCYRLSLKRHRNNIQTLWEDLAQIFGSPSASPQDIVQQIYQHWQTQTVMLCLLDVDMVRGKYLNQLISQLWQPLIKMVQQNDLPADEHPLLLFLIDNLGCKEKLGIPLVSQFDRNKPDIPLELQEITPFEEKEIKRWVRSKNQLFTTQALNSNTINDINDITEDIINRNDTPEKALIAICSWCSLDWHMDIETGLAL
ncbi:hypothetical protein [Brasilonema sp. UFV-L1]|uniref:hypothetical protein n=1 Tax=Brasilonema sp. UFV-L1 TaxID=2234130 RepID=UPI00145F8EBD|nr:hypothetical protein [Brasilonema sp. UFV-L1]NMG11608.1 hypothetical protein [Brasilonema sp. UFV-L1]